MRDVCSARLVEHSGLRIRRLLVAGVWVGLALPGLAQARKARVAVDSVSIKPHDANDGGMRVETTNDRYSASGVSLAGLIVFAYGMQREEQVTGLTGAAEAARFDVELKTVAGTVETLEQYRSEERFDKLRAAMKRALADRFKLKARVEKREMPIYVLAAAAGGTKLTMIAGSDVPPPDEIDGPEMITRAGGITRRNGFVKADDVPISLLAGTLEEQVNRAVRDDTGLRGRYSFTLEWILDGRLGAPAESVATANFLSLSTALQDGLGLRLDSSKELIDTAAVDQVEMADLK